MQQATTLPLKSDFKSQAKVLRFLIGEEHVKYGQALDLLSKEYGFKDWNTASASLNEGESIDQKSLDFLKENFIGLNPESSNSFAPNIEQAPEGFFDNWKSNEEGLNYFMSRGRSTFIRNLISISSKDENRFIPVMVRIKDEKDIKENHFNDFPLYIKLTSHIPMSHIIEVYNFEEGIFHVSPVDGTLIKIPENIISCVEIGSRSCIGEKEEDHYRSSKFGSSAKEKEGTFSNLSKMILPMMKDQYLEGKVIPALKKWRKTNNGKTSNGLSPLKGILEIMERSTDEGMYLSSISAFMENGILFSSEMPELSRFSRHKFGEWFKKKEIMKKLLKEVKKNDEVDEMRTFGRILTSMHEL